MTFFSSPSSKLRRQPGDLFQIYLRDGTVEPRGSSHSSARWAGFAISAMAWRTVSHSFRSQSWPCCSTRFRASSSLRSPAAIKTLQAEFKEVAATWGTSTTKKTSLVGAPTSAREGNQRSDGQTYNPPPRRAISLLLQPAGSVH